jgi:hypothetical protein
LFIVNAPSAAPISPSGGTPLRDHLDTTSILRVGDIVDACLPRSALVECGIRGGHGGFAVQSYVS